MTDSRRCGWCGQVFVTTPGPGRPRLYCRQSCRQANYLSRRLAVLHGLDETNVVVSRAALDELLDRRGQLALALDDLRRDRGRTGSDGLEWLVEHVERLLEVEVRVESPAPAGPDNVS